MKEKKEDALSIGLISEMYTDKTFCKVYQAFGIDKVKFSFAKIGEGGKGVDIYMDVDTFDLLCADIISGDMKTQFLTAKKDDKGYYPITWQFKTGEKANKSISLMRGLKQPVVLKGSDTLTKENVMVSTTYDQLRVMAKWWKRVSGPYYSRLAAIGYEAPKAYKP